MIFARFRLGSGPRLLATTMIAAVGGGSLGCVWLFQRPEVEAVSPQAGVRVVTSVKAHLADGSVVVFPEGVIVTETAVRGHGQRYDLRLQPVGIVQEVLLKDVVAMESFKTVVDRYKSTAVSLLTTPVAAFGAALLAVAIFGSCPTVYSDGGARLQAETFSYSVAPLLEARDLDRLHTYPDDKGVLHLEVRNEALETHYLNHLQVLEVRHERDEIAMADDEGRPVIVGARAAPVSAVDRAGRDVRGMLAEADDSFFRSDVRVVAGATGSDSGDWIETTASVPPGSKKMALVLRARNSLLNTILFYDVMLAPSGARALDWLAVDLERISRAVELGRWVRRHLGLRVEVWLDGGFREVARVPDPGPIAWHDVAAVISVPRGARELRVRLSFLSDSWRIDHLAWASVRDAEPILLPAQGVMGPSGKAEPEAERSLRAPDENYLCTSPGQRFSLSFRARPAPTGLTRSFLLSSQGYYTEWIRGEWLRAGNARAFRPSDDALDEAFRRWREIGTSFEERFARQRVPVM